MNLESLPNELLLSLFDYFDGSDLLRIFYSLNSRFNHLYWQLLFYRFSFHCISKRHFDIICQQHLPVIADRVISLWLSDSNETPAQISLFLSYISSFKIFTHLQSLTILNLRSYPIFLKLLDQCEYLPNLIHVSFNCCFSKNCFVNLQLITDKIWSLPKLTSCYLNIGYANEENRFYLPTISSTSLECIAINYGGLQWNDINQLIHFTPQLKYLKTFINSSPTSNNTVTIFPTVIKCYFKLYNVPDVTSVGLLFQSMPNLCCLNISIRFGLMGGHRWEHIIRSHLSRLKIFRLAMEKYFRIDTDIEKKVDILYNSFCTPFWINERKWFIWCLTKSRTIYLYTRSNASNCFNHICPDTWRSTCPDDNLQEFYNHMTKPYVETVCNKLPLSDIRLLNIEYLHTKFPIDDRFWPIMPSLDKLTTLSVSSYADIYQSELQTLLERAPNVRSLAINLDASLPLQMSLFIHASASIRELNFYAGNYDFDEIECLLLTRSSLSVQCEVLSIRVRSRASIIFLVKNMNKLRSLIVKCADNQYYKRLIWIDHSEDELIQWLKDHLPSTYLIVRRSANDNDILIWM